MFTNTSRARAFCVLQFPVQIASTTRTINFTRCTLYTIIQMKIYNAFGFFLCINRYIRYIICNAANFVVITSLYSVHVILNIACKKTDERLKVVENCARKTGIAHVRSTFFYFPHQQLHDPLTVKLFTMRPAWKNLRCFFVFFYIQTWKFCYNYFFTFSNARTARFFRKICLFHFCLYITLYIYSINSQCTEKLFTFIAYAIFTDI